MKLTYISSIPESLQNSASFAFDSCKNKQRIVNQWLQLPNRLAVDFRTIETNLARRLSAAFFFLFRGAAVVHLISRPTADANSTRTQTILYATTGSNRATLFLFCQYEHPKLPIHGEACRTLQYTMRLSAPKLPIPLLPTRTTTASEEGEKGFRQTPGRPPVFLPMVVVSAPPTI